MEWIHEERILISIPYFSLIVKNYTEESCLHHRPQRCSSSIQEQKIVLSSFLRYHSTLFR